MHLLDQARVQVGIEPLTPPSADPKKGEHHGARRLIVGNPTAGGAFACVETARQVGGRGVAEVTQQHRERRHGDGELCKVW